MIAKRWYFVLLTVAVFALAACTVPVAPAEEGAGPAEGEDVVEILFWDQFPDVSDQMDAVVADFNASHPNINVTRESYQTEALRDVINTALSSGTGPDIFYYDLGPGFAGVLADAGLILPLNDAYADYGWDEKIYQWTQDRSTFQGNTYGVANELEFIGVFYNQTMFEENGWEIPQSWDELIGMCGTINEAGIIPMGFTNGPSWPSYHMFSMMMNNQVGRERLAEMISGEAPWDSEETIAAIDKFFVQAQEAGCFPPDVNAISYEDGLALLKNGQAAMHPSGTWNVDQFTPPQHTGDPIGFFFLPPIDGGEVVVPGGIGSGWLVSAATENPEEVLTFLDYLVSDEMGKRWLEEIQIIPAYPVDTEAANIPELLAFAAEIIGEQAETMGYNIDVLTPDNFNKVMWDGFAAVLAGVKTPEEQAADLQAAMATAVEEGSYIDITE